MDPEEEKAQELDLLQSMYPEELNIVSDSVFTILLPLEQPTTSNGDQAGKSAQSLLVRVEYTEDYPQSLPLIELSVETTADEDSGDESEDEDAKKRKVEVYHINNEDLNVLRESAAEEAEINLGFPSIFAITSSLKDKAESLLQDKLSEKEKEREEKARQEEEIEQAKFRGTLVNRENFIEWRRKFKAEMAALEQKDTKEDDSKRRPSGREIFEKGLEGSKSTEQYEDEDIENGVKNVSIS
ncbi:hypothetical protein V1512DRAFT_233716 [Lipomyces arxii]|uniref:uncharacterized protein n=1 Tax=Lipomyces arxii TaxID=56418 RepID=UPI0034CF9C95